MRRFLFFIALVPIVLLVGTAIGPLHPVGDSLAVFRFQIGLVAFLTSAILFYTAPSRYTGAACVLALAASGTIWFAAMPSDMDSPNHYTADNSYSVYQKNLSFRLRDVAPIIADITRIKPDFVTLQEVTFKNTAILEALTTDYPSQKFCKFKTVGGVAVASRFPIVQNTALCSDNNGLAAIKVTTPDGPIWLVSIHLQWPFPFDQAEHVEQLLPILSSFDAPVILGGDFNMVPWSHTMTQIENAIGSNRLGRVTGTFNLKNTTMIPIDHVLAPAPCNHRNSILDLLGSDHHGVLAEFNPTC